MRLPWPLTQLRLEDCGSARAMPSAGADACNRGNDRGILKAMQGWVHMKGAFRLTSPGFLLLLGFYLAVFRARADTVYMSTLSENTIYKFDPNGNGSLFPVP